MRQHAGYRYRLYPTAEQEAALTRWAGCARTIWNAGLEQRLAAWRICRRTLRYEDQGGTDLSEAKHALPWLAEAHSDVLQQSLRDLDRAFNNFFAGRAGHPRPRRKGRRERFRIQSRRGKAKIEVRRLNRRWGHLRVPKLGWVRFRWTRAPVGTIKHLTVSRDALGWHVSLCTESEVEAPLHHPGPPIGIDRGVNITVALSTADLRSCPGLRPGQAERMRRLARKAGRQETARRRRPAGDRRRSAQHQRTLDAIASLRAREARIRTDFLHKLSRELANNHGLVAIEALRIKAMTRSAKGSVDDAGQNVAQKRGLNRAILTSGWGELGRQLAYKTARAGGVLVEVPAAHSSRTCGKCGYVDEANRQGRRFQCNACGHRAHADINAARVILARALEAQEEGGQARPSQHGEPSAYARPRTVNHSEALAA